MTTLPKCFDVKLCSSLHYTMLLKDGVKTPAHICRTTKRAIVLPYSRVAKSKPTLKMRVGEQQLSSRLCRGQDGFCSGERIFVAPNVQGFVMNIFLGHLRNVVMGVNDLDAV